LSIRAPLEEHRKSSRGRSAIWLYARRRRNVWCKLSSIYIVWQQFAYDPLLSHSLLWEFFPFCIFSITRWSVKPFWRAMPRRAIAMMSVRLSVHLGRACIVIIRCTLALIYVCGWIVQCSGHPETKACLPTPSRLFPVPPGIGVRYVCANYRLDISRTVKDRGLSYYWVLIGTRGRYMPSLFYHVWYGRDLDL